MFNKNFQHIFYFIFYFIFSNKNMSADNTVSIVALVFLVILVICVIVALCYNPAPVECVKRDCPKTPNDLITERLKCRSPPKGDMCPRNRAASTPGSDDFANNDPWAVMEKIVSEREMLHNEAL